MSERAELIHEATERHRWLFATPIGAIQFTNLLVQSISTKFGFKEGLHIVPEGALEEPTAEPRFIFLEPNVLAIEGVEFNRIDFSKLGRLKKKSCKFLVSTLPLFGQPQRRDQPDELISRYLEVARVLADDGVGVLLAPTFYRTFVRGRLIEVLAKEGVYVMGMVNAPPRFLLPSASIQPMFLIVSRQKPSETFAFDCRNYENLVLNIENVLDYANTGELGTGITLDLPSFRGFEHWYAQREIEALEGDYAQYERFTLAEVSLFINIARIGEDFEDLPNAIYLPIFGNGDAVNSLIKTTMKHQSYCQIVVDTAKTTSEFLCNFLNTRHFRLYLEAEKLAKNAVTPRIGRDQVRALPVALPNLETQKKISSNIKKLAVLRSMVDELVQNLSVNPVSSKSMTRQLDEALSVFGRLSAEDQLYSILQSGESKTAEFKQTFSLDISNNTKQRFLEDMVVKTIAAFLNSDGGDLLVGVDDDGKVTGIEIEIDKLHRNSRDRFLKHFKNVLKERIGEQFYPIIQFDTVELSGSLVFHVKCQPSDVEVFVDGKDFFVRTNPATDKLEGPTLTAYVKQRFHNTAVAVLG